ncbi:MAG: hypothetical protein ACPG8W_00145 [Candidatus Promineifilaceae bacterium]
MKKTKNKKQAQLKVNTNVRAGFSFNAFVDNLQAFATDVGDAAQGAVAGAKDAIADNVV